MMHDQKLTYTVTTIASSDLNLEFVKAKQQFYSFIEQPLTKGSGHILKNTAHLTLKRSFYLHDNVSEERLISKLRAVSFKPITINSSSIDTFITPKFGNVLVLLVNNTIELHQLHTNIVNNVKQISSNQSEVYELELFKPHLSVLYNVPDNLLETAKIYIRDNILPVSFRLDSFLLMKEVKGVINERQKVAEYTAQS